MKKSSFYLQSTFNRSVGENDQSNRSVSARNRSVGSSGYFFIKLFYPILGYSTWHSRFFYSPWRPSCCIDEPRLEEYYKQWLGNLIWIYQLKYIYLLLLKQLSTSYLLVSKCKIRAKKSRKNWRSKESTIEGQTCKKSIPTLRKQLPTHL